MSTPSERANLARIRDNQRRSRARRKEYLQELQARLRQCELHGIEASAEIQLAARKVADENRKLRGLLALHGIGEDSIEAYLHSSPPGDLQSNTQIPTSSALVQNLQHLLQTRKPCCADAQTSHTVSTPGADSREASLTSASTAQSSWDPNSLLFSGMQQTSKPCQFTTPTSTSSISFHSRHNVPQHQGLTSVSAPRNDCPTSMAKQMQMFELDPRLSQLNNAQYITHQGAPQQLQSHGGFQSTYIPTTPSSPNSNSCGFATDTISNMSRVDPSFVRADLGCPPGMDCELHSVPYGL